MEFWLLLVPLMLSACAGPQDNGGLSGEPVPNVQGIYQGSYTYGGAYGRMKGQSVPFEISLRQAPGSHQIKGVIKETYNGFGTMKDGFLWADIKGTCEAENGVVHLQFLKIYRHFKHPSVSYLGTLPQGSGLLAGTWYFPDKPSDSGMFQISGMHVP